MEPKHWKRISSTEIFSHPRLQLLEDRVELPDGKEIEYLRFAPGAESVAVVAINDKGQLLLQQEYSYPPDEILWQLPGGTVNKDEPVEYAASRELAEESGLRSNDSKVLGFFYTNNRRSSQKQYVVLCTGLVPESAERDAEEFISSHWKSIDEVKSMLAKGEFHNINLLASLNLYFATVKYPGFRA